MTKSNFILFSTGRSGSNLFKNLLKSHPNVFCDDELFNSRLYAIKHPFIKSYIPRHPKLYINYKKAFCKKDVYGFKMMSNHLVNMREVMQKLSEKGWKIIHLQRKNLLKQSFSWLIAEKTNKWVRWEGHDAPTETYYIPIVDLLTNIKKQIAAKTFEEDLLKTLDHISIVYEEGLKFPEKWQSTAARSFKYLGVAPVEVSSPNRITDPRKDSDRIKNFDEIIRYLNTNGFAHLVDSYYNDLENTNKL